MEPARCELERLSFGDGDRRIAIPVKGLAAHHGPPALRQREMRTFDDTDTATRTRKQ
jgi:hypothetical protein